MQKSKSLFVVFVAFLTLVSSVWTHSVELTHEEFNSINQHHSTPVLLGAQSRMLFEQAGGNPSAADNLVSIHDLQHVFTNVTQSSSSEVQVAREQLFKVLHTYSLEVGPQDFKDVVIADDFLVQTKQVCEVMQTVVAQLRPPTRELIVGTLFITNGLCARGDLHLESDVTFNGDICISPGKTLLTNNINSKLNNGIVVHDTMQVVGDVCIEPAYGLSVDTIDSKSGNGLWIGDELHVGGSVHIKPTHVLSVDTIDSKSEIGVRIADALKVQGSVCIDSTYALSVDTVDSKSGIGITVEDDIHVNGSVCVRDDLIIKRKLIVPGELQVSASDDVMIGENQCLFVDCIKPLSSTGTTTVQNLGVIDGKRLLVNNIVAIDSNDKPDPSGTTDFASSICMAPHTTLSVNRIAPKGTGDSVTLDAANITGDLSVGQSIIVDDIRLQTAHAIAMPSLCLDSTATLSVNHIASKGIGDAITLTDVILDSAAVNGDVNVLSTLFTTSVDASCDVIVRKKLLVDTIVPVLTTTVTFDSNIKVNGDINVCGGQFLLDGNPFSSETSFIGFLADDDLEMNNRNISGCNFLFGQHVFGLQLESRQLLVGSGFDHSFGHYGVKIEQTAIQTEGTMTIENFDHVHFWDAGIRVSGANITVDGMVVLTSDRRMKESIASIAPQESLEKVMQLRPCTFMFKDEFTTAENKGKTQRGFIAQEVEKILPELICIQQKNEHEREQLKDLPDDLRTMSYSHLTVDIIGALQALNQKLSEQADEIAQLHQAIAGLHAAQVKE